MFTQEFISEIADAVASRVAERLSLGSSNGAVQPRLLDTEQASRYLGLPSASALRQRKCAGQIPDDCFVKMGGSVMYDREALDRWIASLKEAA